MPNILPHTDRGLLTADNCAVVFIDHQPQMTFGVASGIDRQRCERAGPIGGQGRREGLVGEARQPLDAIWSEETLDQPLAGGIAIERSGEVTLIWHRAGSDWRMGGSSGASFIASSVE